jgi:DNA polymerase
MLEQFEAEFGDAGKPLSQLIRPSFVAPKGRTLVWGDWAAIEARKLPWLADSPGAREVLDVFRQSDADPDAPDIYMREAGNIRSKEPGEVTKDERQEGKVAVLSLGFGGAVGALQAMAAGYGLSLTDAEAKRIVDLWRSNNPWARQFWDELWAAFQAALGEPGHVFEAGRVTFLYAPDHRRTVFMFLPDGRPLAYPNVRWGTKQVENEKGETEERYGLLYRRGDETRQLWYGTLAENATQGVAGSRLRETLTLLSPAPRLDGAGGEVWERGPGNSEIVGHTHDEIIAECDDNDEAIEETALWLGDGMLRAPGWAPDCPMSVELSTCYYYSKHKEAAEEIAVRSA